MLFSNKKLGLALLACAVILPAAPAKADLATIKNSNSEIWASAGISLLNYQEIINVPQDIPDSEHGWNPSLATGLSYMSPKQSWYTSIDFADTFGTSHYNGSLFDNATGFYDIPAQLSSMTNIINVDAKFGKGVGLGRYFMLTPYVDLGYRHWGRKLGSGQTENYHNYDLDGGLMFQAAPTRRLILTTYAALGTTIGAEMRADATGDNYDLGSAGVYKVGAKIGYDLTERVELFTTLDYDAFRYVQSQPALDTSFEPTSKTEDTTLRVGFGYHFR